MNNLIIKRQELVTRQLVVHGNLPRLIEFLKFNEKLFIENDSQEALKRMKAYIKGKNELLEALWKEREQLNKDINLTCKHEILIEKTTQLSCLICDSWFFVKDVNFDHILLKEKEENPDCISTSREIERIIFEMARKGEDPIESFEDYSYENPKLEKVRIYKRRISK